jgi:8-oxo-dGTP diphosphatase
VLTVVAGLIQHQGKLLVCQRRRGSRLELLWEFPGGKREAGEALEEALARELREELGASAKIGPEVYRTQHTYADSDRPLEIVFFAASALPDDVRNLEFEQIEWRTPESLPELDFLPADRELIQKLANGVIRVPQLS